MASTTPSDNYLSIPTFIAPVSFDAGVPSTSPRSADGALPPDSASRTPSPTDDDPWSAAQRKESPKIDSATPKSPARQRASKFAVAAPSSGAAGFQKHRSPPPTEDHGLAPGGTTNITTSPSPDTTPLPTPAGESSLIPPSRSASSGSALSKSLARLSKSISGRSRSTNKKSKSGSASDTPFPTPPLPQAQAQESMTPNSSRPGSVRARSFAIPQTLEEWEAFNKAILERPPPVQQPLPQGLAPPRLPFAPGTGRPRPSSTAGSSRPMSMVGTNTPGSSQPASPNQSPKMRPLPDLPPPPIVQAEWERNRSWDRPKQSSKQPKSRPSSPPPGASRPNIPRKSSAPPSAPASADESTVSLPKFVAQPVPDPLPTPSPTPLPTAESSSAEASPSVPTEQPPSVISGAPLRLRTTSLPDGGGNNAQRPQLSPIVTSVPSPSLKWNRPMSWVGNGVKPASTTAAPKAAAETKAATLTKRSRSASVTEVVVAEAVKRGSVEIQRDTMSNGARLKAKRKSSQDNFHRKESTAPNVLSKQQRRQSQTIEPTQLAPQQHVAFSASAVDVSATTKRPQAREASSSSTLEAGAGERTSRRFSTLGMKAMFSRASSSTNLAATAAQAGNSRTSSFESPQLVRTSQEGAAPAAPSEADVSAPKSDAPSQPTPPKHARKGSFTQRLGGMKLFRKESSTDLKQSSAPAPRPAGLMVQVPPTGGSLSDNMPALDGAIVASPGDIGASPRPRETPASAGPQSAKRRSRRFSFTDVAKGIFRRESSSDGGHVQASSTSAPPARPAGLAAPVVPGMQATSPLVADSMMIPMKAALEGAPGTPDRSFKMSFGKKKAAPALEDEFAVSPAQKERIERMMTPPNVPSPTLDMGERSLPAGLFKTGGSRPTTAGGHNDGEEEKIDPGSNRVSRFLSDLAASNELGLRVSPPDSTEGPAGVEVPLPEVDGGAKTGVSDSNTAKSTAFEY